MSHIKEAMFAEEYEQEQNQDIDFSYEEYKNFPTTNHFTSMKKIFLSILAMIWIATVAITNAADVQIQFLNSNYDSWTNKFSRDEVITSIPNCSTPNVSHFWTMTITEQTAKAAETDLFMQLKDKNEINKLYEFKKEWNKVLIVAKKPFNAPVLVHKNYWVKNFQKEFFASMLDAKIASFSSFYNFSTFSPVNALRHSEVYPQEYTVWINSPTKPIITVKKMMVNGKAYSFNENTTWRDVIWNTKNWESFAVSFDLSVDFSNWKDYTHHSWIDTDVLSKIKTKESDVVLTISSKLEIYNWFIWEKPENLCFDSNWASNVKIEEENAWFLNAYNFGAKQFVTKPVETKKPEPKKETPKPNPVVKKPEVKKPEPKKEEPKPCTSNCTFDWDNTFIAVGKIYKLDAKICTANANYAIVDTKTGVRVYFYSKENINWKMWVVRWKWNYSLQQIQKNPKLYKSFRAKIIWTYISK